MGVDYQARKTAKKSRKAQRGEELKPRRERKKKQARRLCRGTCYQEPGLKPEDLAEEGGGGGPRVYSGGGELARFANMDFGDDRGAKGSQKGDKPKPKAQPGGKRKQQQQQAEQAEQQGGSGGSGGGARSAKKPRLSTAVNLLDAKTARIEAPRARALPAGQVSPELLQYPELLQRFMAGEGLAEPMPIQSSCWPLALAGRDVEALAEPGAGKTLAYLLPCAALLAEKGHGAATQPDGPLALVLLPTRELAQQVASACRDLRKYSGLRCACITGGVDKGLQLEALAKQPHIVIATPGRLLDLVQEGALQLGRVHYCILDEADKMLGLGFAPQIDALRALLLPPAGAAAAGGAPAKKQRRVQVGLYTATMPDSLAEVAAHWLHRPQRVRVAPDAACIARSVSQVVQVCAEHKKPAKLSKHLEQIRAAAAGQRNPPRVLVFANRIKTVRFVHGLVSEAGFRAAQLHGERSQEERDAAVADFRSGKVQVLVATDVAARGLHIRGLPYVVNYDFPGNLEQYIHRVGRTGRLATDGHAFSFFTREMARLAPPLVQLLQAHEQALDPNLVKLAEAFAIAAQKLGLVADATGEAAGQPQREDVLQELGLKTQQQKKRDKAAAKKAAKKGARAGAAQAPASDSEGWSSEEDEEAAAAPARDQRGGQQPPAAKAQQAQAAAAVPADEREAVDFIPAKAWAGARPGYAFKKGRQGLGYYLDPVQQQQGGGGGGGKRHKGGAGAAAKAAHKAELQELKRKWGHAPIGGRMGGAAAEAKPAASAKARRESAAAASAKPAAAAAKPAAPLLPGRLKELKRQRQQAAAAGQLAGFSDDEDEPAPAASKRAKALPGRLRKKLAQQKKAGGGD